jgi:hypothetical protein
MAPHTRETVDFDSAASAPSDSASAASTSRVDRPRTQPAIVSDSSRVGSGDVLAQQSGGARLVSAVQFGPLVRHRPRRGLDGDVTVAVARPGTGAVAPLEAFAAEEPGDLGLQRGLQDQPRAQMRDVRDRLAEVTVAGEQGVDLGEDAVGG